MSVALILSDQQGLSNDCQDTMCYFQSAFIFLLYAPAICYWIVQGFQTVIHILFHSNTNR